MNRKPTSYRLADAAERAAASPDFEIPPEAERESLRPADYVKLLFLYPEPLPDGCNGERMWVRVYGRRMAYFGTLANDPKDPDRAGIRFGEVVGFEARHVLAIERARS